MLFLRIYKNYKTILQPFTQAAILGFQALGAVGFGATTIMRNTRLDTDMKAIRKETVSINQHALNPQPPRNKLTSYSKRACTIVVLIPSIWDLA